MISRGLLISVGVTLLAVGLLFVYFRNKVSGIEKKVELMFNLIQNHEGQNAMQQQQYIPSPPQEMMNQEEVPQMRSELIEVSDDDGDDSEEVSDSEDEDDDDEETLKFEPTTIELTDTDVKTIDLNANIQQEAEEQESEDSLDDIDSDEEEDDKEEKEDEPLETEEVITLTEDDYKKKTVAELKKIASKRGLQNYRSLKKAPLIELLMSD